MEVDGWEDEDDSPSNPATNRVEDSITRFHELFISLKMLAVEESC